MIIKICKPNPTPVSMTQGEPAPLSKDLGYRQEVSWLTIAATRFDYFMTPREGSSSACPLPHESILNLYPQDDEDEVQYDEVCVLTVHAPERYVVVFDTMAFVCNDDGQTMEKINPMRRAIGKPLKVNEETLDQEKARQKPHGFRGRDDYKPCADCGLPFGNGIHTDERFPTTEVRDVGHGHLEGIEHHAFKKARDGKCFVCGLSHSDLVHNVKKPEPHEGAK